MRARLQAGHRPSHLPPELLSPRLIMGRKSGRRADPQSRCLRLPGHPLPFIPPRAATGAPTKTPPQHEDPFQHRHQHSRSAPVQHPDPQHLAKLLWKSKFAFGEHRLTRREGDETASGRDFLTRATPRDFGPTTGPPAPPGQHPPCPASSPGTGQHFCMNISPLRLLQRTLTWPSSTQNCLLANHKSTGNRERPPARSGAPAGRD